MPRTNGGNGVHPAALVRCRDQKQNASRQRLVPRGWRSAPIGAGHLARLASEFASKGVRACRCRRELFNYSSSPKQVRRTAASFPCGGNRSFARSNACMVAADWQSMRRSWFAACMRCSSLGDIGARTGTARVWVAPKVVDPRNGTTIAAGADTRMDGAGLALQRPGELGGRLVCARTIFPPLVV